MKISVVGSGYVGLVTAACLSDMGHQVIGVDTDKQKIAKLQQADLPLHEPGLSTLISQCLSLHRLSFTADLSEALVDCEVVFIAVGTPSCEDGSVDLSYVFEVVHTIGAFMMLPLVIVNKSTVPVGTADRIHTTLADTLKQRGKQINYAVISNPEFLKQGTAVADFQRPDRIIIGGREKWALDKIYEIYKLFQRNHDKLMVMDNRSAELTKYAANAMLATRISFMNEMANLAEYVGADIEKVRHGIGSDTRIGFDFLYAGGGYGGSCFPKDIKAILHTANEHHYHLPLIEAVQHINQKQKHRIVEKVQKRFGDELSKMCIAIWGLAFKANTDDIREALSITVMEDLAQAGVKNVQVFDQEAMPNTQTYLQQHPIKGLSVCFAKNLYDTLRNADVLLILTEWKVFRVPDWAMIQARLKRAVIFDAKNLYDPHVLAEKGIDYVSIGRAP